jgi:hypothetical protein
MTAWMIRRDKTGVLGRQSAPCVDRLALPRTQQVAPAQAGLVLLRVSLSNVQSSAWAEPAQHAGTAAWLVDDKHNAQAPQPCSLAGLRGVIARRDSGSKGKDSRLGQQQFSLPSYRGHHHPIPHRTVPMA